MSSSPSESNIPTKKKKRIVRIPKDLCTTQALGAINAKLGELSASLTDLRAHRQTTAAQVAAEPERLLSEN